MVGLERRLKDQAFSTDEWKGANGPLPFLHSIHWNQKKTLTLFWVPERTLKKEESDFVVQRFPVSEKRDLLQDAMVESEGEEKIP